MVHRIQRSYKEAWDWPETFTKSLFVASVIRFGTIAAHFVFSIAIFVIALPLSTLFIALLLALSMTFLFFIATVLMFDGEYGTLKVYEDEDRQQELENRLDNKA